MSDHPRHLLDRLLRRAGFRIHARPKGGPAKWQRGKVVLTQDQALKRVLLEEQGCGASG